jgi:hypothetical protein
MKNKLFILVLVLFCQTQAFAAAFSIPSRLINIPVSKPFKADFFEFGTSAAIYSGTNYEFDFMMNYMISDEIIVGVSMPNMMNLVFNFHYNFFEAKKYNNLSIGAGLLNITDAKYVSPWDEYEVDNENHWSPYVVGSMKYGDIQLHAGLGKRRFEGSYHYIVAEDDIITGLFWGAELQFLSGYFMLEFDGCDYNVGYRMFLDKKTEFNIALTELFIDGDKNPSYGNGPIRQLTFGFVLRDDLFNQHRKREEEYQEKYREKLNSLNSLRKDLLNSQKLLEDEFEIMQDNRKGLEKEISKLHNSLKDEKKFFFKQDQKTKTDLRTNYLGANNILGEEVINLYYQSFTQYYNKQYSKAIETLSKAIMIDPYIPMLHVRLGTIYYTLGLRTEAVKSWQKALDLDPYNEEVINLLHKYNALPKK